MTTRIGTPETAVPGSHAASSPVESSWPAGLQLYASQVAGLVPPAPEEARELLARARLGDERARDRLTRRHLGLVLEAVRKTTPSRADALQLLEEGNLELARAIQDFAPETGDEFRGYAASRVRKALARLTCSSC